MRILRVILIIFCITLAAFILHLSVYNTVFTYEHISNVLFGISIIIFLPTIVAITRAYEVFQGINYVFRSLLSPAFRNQYPRFKEFKDEKSTAVKSTIFYDMLVAAFVVLVVAFVLAEVAMR